VRLLRFIALLLVVAIVYSVQALLRPSDLTASILSILTQGINFIVDFSPLRALFVGNTRDLAFFWLAIAAVTFGLLAAPWPLTDKPASVTVATGWTPRARRRQRLAWGTVIVGLLLSLVASVAAWLQFSEQASLESVGRFSTAGEALLPRLSAFWEELLALLAQAPWLTLALWAASLFCFFIGGGLFPARLQSTEPEYSSAAVHEQPQSAAASWPLFLLLLSFAVVQVGWRLTEIPSFVNPAVAQLGLAASDWLRAGESSPFFAMPLEIAVGLDSFSRLPVALPALFFQLTQDLLLSTRLAGLWATLLVLTATWLLGTELFRRVPHRLAADLNEDRGQGPALMATILVMFTGATLLFSRFPVLLEIVGWGSLGCWALLRGWRTQDRLAVGLSGVLIGLSALLYTPGFAFVLIALCWWIGFAFVQWGWVPHCWPAQRTGALFRGHFVLWVIGLWVVAAPTLGVRWFALRQWLPPLPGNLTRNWQPTLLALGQQGDLSQLGGWPVPLLHDLLAPLFILAIGALAFNLDRRVGWLLLTWLGVGLLAAMWMVSSAPQWPALLPVLPATGLVLAFGLDRLRAALLQSAGPWLRNLVNYLLAGLMLWVGLNNGVDYYHFAHQQADVVGALGYELRALSVGRPIIVVAPPNAAGVASDTPQLRFLTNDWQRPPRMAVTFTETVPDDAPAGAVILIAPAAPTVLAELQTRYPNGRLFVRRDQRANPLLYRYTLPDGQ